MEQTNRIIITKKEGKLLKNFQRVCEILGYDFSKISVLEEKINELSDDKKRLEDKIELLSKENERLINEKMNQIAVNIQNKAAQSNAVSQMKNFGFKGKTIDETF